MDIDWPLAIELALVFALFSYVRWRYFKRRMRNIGARQSETKNGTPK